MKPILFFYFLYTLSINAVFFYSFQDLFLLFLFYLCTNVDSFLWKKEGKEINKFDISIIPEIVGNSNFLCEVLKNVKKSAGTVNVEEHIIAYILAVLK